MPKNIPQRMCVVCRKMMDKSHLNRVVKTTDGTVCMDFTGKIEGRGAYVCFDENCINKCKKTKLLNKHLKTTVPEDIFENFKVNK